MSPRWPDDPSWLGPPSPAAGPGGGPPRPVDPRPAPLRVPPSADLTSGEPSSAGCAEPPVDRIGPYRLLSTIGQGGMGIVYRGRAPDGRDVAIKVLVPPFSDGDRVGRFDRERRLLLGLSETEGFVPLLDFGESALGPFLVMPFVPGGTLRGRLQAGSLPVVVAVDLLGQVARAIGRAHERGVVHRDLKPENVLFTADRRPLVADLGLAKHFRRGSFAASTIVGPQTASRAFLGTIGYAAPEQMADGRSVGPPADVFALGAIFYECLAGSPPFAANNVVELVRRIEKAAFPPLLQVRAMPQAVADLVDRALARDPAARFEDARALERALARCLDGGVTPAGSTLDVPPPNAGTATLAMPPPLTRPTPAASGDRGRSQWSDDSREPGDSSGEETGDPDEPPAAPPSQGPTQQQTLVLGAALGASLALLLAVGAVGVATWLRGAREGEPADGGTAVVPSGAPGRATEPRPERVVVRDAAEAGRLTDAAASAGDTGDTGAAIELATRAIGADPGFATAWCVRARARLLVNDLQGAHDDATQAIGLRPDQGSAWAVRAAVQSERGELRGAREEADRAIGLEPDDPLGWHVRSVVALARGEWDRAISDATEALERGAPPFARVTRARALHARGDLARARADLDETLSVTPDAFMALRERGAVRLAQDDPSGAADDLARALAQVEADARAHGLRAQALLALGDPQAALVHADRAIALGPEEPDVYSVAAAAHARLGSPERGIAVLDAAARGWPDNAFVFHHRGLLRRDRADLNGALMDLALAVRLAPRDPVALRALGELRARTGDEDGAIEALEASLRLAPDDEHAPRIRELLETLRAQ